MSPDSGAVGVHGDFEAYEEEARVQANLVNGERDILNADLTNKLAFCSLYESKSIDAQSGLGPLDILKALNLAPITVRVMADLDKEQKNNYKNLTRWLDTLTGFVEKASPIGKQFKAYYLTETGMQWASEQEWS